MPLVIEAFLWQLKSLIYPWNIPSTRLEIPEISLLALLCSLSCMICCWQAQQQSQKPRILHTFIVCGLVIGHELVSKATDYRSILGTMCLVSSPAAFTFSFCHICLFWILWGWILSVYCGGLINVLLTVQLYSDDDCRKIYIWTYCWHLLVSMCIMHLLWCRYNSANCCKSMVRFCIGLKF